MNNNVKKNGSTVYFALSTDESISVSCYYGVTLWMNPPSLSEISSNGRTNLDVSHITDEHFHSHLEYSVPRSKKQGIHKYRCAADNIFTEVALSYNGKFLPVNRDF